MKLALIIFTCLFISSTTISLSQSANEKKADRKYELMEYVDALEYYKKAEEKKPSDVTKIKLAKSYRKLNNIVKVEEWYAKVEDKELMSHADHYEYAQALSANGKYKQAEKWFTKYLGEELTDSRSKEKIYAVTHVDDYYVDSANYTIIDLPEVNSEFSEFGPCLYEGGILFVSNRSAEFGVKHKYKWDNSHFLDVYFAERGDSAKGTTTNYVKPHRFNAAVNSKYHEGQMTISEDEKEIIFGRNYYLHHAKKSTDKAIKKSIFYAEKTTDGKHGHGWHHVNTLPFDNPEYSVMHPSATKDFKTLYFSSDIPGGLGGADIWVSYRQGKEKWSTPVNLGRPINTEGNEGFPFIHEDGTLYYVSDGHGGLGGYDIFEATPGDSTGEFTTIKNMGYPINTHLDDFGLIIDTEKKFGYFASNREGGKGQDDIYKVKIKQDRFELSGNTFVMLEGGYEAEREILGYTNLSVYEKGRKEVLTEVKADSLGLFSVELRLGRNYQLIGTKDSLLADTLDLDFSKKLTLDNEEIELVLLEPAGKNIFQIVLIDLVTKEIIPGATVFLLNKVSKEITTLKSDSLGMVVASLNPDNDYLIRGKKTKYLANGYRFNSGKPCRKRLTTDDLPLEAIRINSRMVLSSIFFDFAKWNIREDAAIELDKIAAFILVHPGVVVELGSHTDSRGSDKYNKYLSQKRAKSSVDYISSKGVQKDDLSAVGYGETIVINKCENGVLCTKEEHQINRRTEIKITGIREVDPAQAKRLEDEERRSFDTESDYLEFQEVAIIKITET
jgi:outer membrane protein OmpA-like peptidoglycan-associated protein/tetratricopeptide (TPR) repeat protein